MESSYTPVLCGLLERGGLGGGVGRPTGVWNVGPPCCCGVGAVCFSPPQGKGYHHLGLGAVSPSRGKGTQTRFLEYAWGE